ncbi:hypothetical protein D0863_06825 [Hortaea werneckii]|uniref:Zn(2)-C6 fungal-type domain-containing protein n=1 Tax=Hortaea werneckii TaxID=91943 RepID=A0A3M7DX33_HORWE|nr:hypothetical protein D0863_06825 [Hortaea werneckii]
MEDSPNSDILNNMAGMAPTPSVLGPGQHNSSDYGFGGPPNYSIDSMLQPRPNAPAHTPGAPAMAGSMQHNLGSGMNSGMMSSPSMNTAGSAMQQGLPDGMTATSGHDHRLSMSSNGPYSGLERNNSLAGSDTASPTTQGRGGIGGNAFTNDSNDSSNPTNQSNTSQPNDSQASVPPPWSELKTKAGKERKRLPLACIACRRKKIRCSGEKPACKHCLRSRIPCVYKVTTRKAAPRTDYMAMLDRRLRRMEERVIKILPKEEQAVVSSTGRAQVRPPLPPAPPKPPSGTKKRGADQAFGDELEEWANPIEPEKHVNDVDDEQQQSTAENEPLQAHEAEEQNLLREGADKLPPKELQEHLTEVFFDYVYGQSYHLLHKPSFTRKLAQGTVPPVLMLAVCGISARFSNHPALRTEPAFLRGESWASAARDIALRRYDTPNITILIVYLILGLHEFGTCQGGRSWMFGGMAQRMAYALQLHKDLDHDPKLRRSSEGKNGEGDLTFTDREIRRRTMWSCFIMDRFNSSGTDRPIFVAEQYIRAQLPIRENYFQMEITGPTEDLNGNVSNPVEPDTGQVSDAKANMGVAAYLIRIVAIWGKLVHYLNLGGKDRDTKPMWEEGSIFQTIRKDTEDWKESLPDGLKYTTENLENFVSDKMANQFLFMHIVYNQTILFSNRFALPTPGIRTHLPKDMPQEFIQSASAAALEAANTISALVHESMDHLVVAPFAGYCAFFSSTVHIYGAFSQNVQLEATSKQNLAWNVKYLTRMKKYWGMFHFVTENLRELYRRHADAARLGTASRPGAGGEEGDEKEIFQYGDWFDRYPHGVSGTDYEEPVKEEVKREPGADAVLGQKSDLQTVEEFFSKLSPPSRSAQTQGQQAAAQKKYSTKKRRASKSAAANANGSSQGRGAQQQPRQQQQPQQQQQMSQEQQQQDNLQNTQHSFGSQQMQQGHMIHDLAHLDAMNHQQAGFTPGFQPAQNPLYSGPPQQLLTQLDRQMVMDSYAGLDQLSQRYRAQQALHNQQQQNMPDGPGGGNFNDPFNLDAFSNYAPPNSSGAGTNNNGGGGPGGFWGDPSTAWFMPFNMEPPSVGDDSNLFANTGNASFDWANFGAGLPGDMSALSAHQQPSSSGLSPHPAAEVAGAQQHQGHQQHDPTLSSTPGAGVMDGF